MVVEEDGFLADDKRDDEEAESIADPPCSVCYDSVTARRITCGSGGHVVCERCFFRLVGGALVLSTARIACPDTTGCGSFFAPSDISHILPLNTRTSYKKVKHNEDLSLEVQQSGVKELVDCSGCGYSQVRPKRSVASVPLNIVRECTHCRSPICLDCGQLEHAPLACGEAAAHGLEVGDEETRILREFQVKISESLILVCEKCSSRESSASLVCGISSIDSRTFGFW